MSWPRGAGPGPVKTLLWSAGLATASLVLLLAAGTEPVRTLRSAVAGLLDPARQAVSGAAETLVDALGAVGDIGSLRAENEALRERLAAAEQRAAELAEAARENAELRELLGLAPELDMELLPARVTGRDALNLVEEVTLDVGSDEGVHAGMPVVAAANGGGALVGTVIEVTAGTSRVRLVVDSRSVVIAVDQETRALGEARGRPGGEMTLVNVPLTEPMAVGDTVVTAGLTVGDDSSRYPPGLLLGRIHAVRADDNAVTHTAFVRPAVDPAEVRRVLIVLDVNGR